MLLVRPFLALLALSPAAAQYMIICEPTKLDSGVERGKDSFEMDTPERALTNAERMQQGLQPGFPKQLSGVLESRARRRDQGECSRRSAIFLGHWTPSDYS